MDQEQELVSVLGTAEGCAVCADETIETLPFASDADALAHLLRHTPEQLAWALLTNAALVHRFLLAVDEPGGIQDERDAEELIKEVEFLADHSPARPPKQGYQSP